MSEFSGELEEVAGGPAGAGPPSFDKLMHQADQPPVANDVPPDDDRVQLVLDAVGALTGDLPLHVLVHRIAALALDLVGARQVVVEGEDTGDISPVRVRSELTPSGGASTRSTVSARIAAGSTLLGTITVSDKVGGGSFSVRDQQAISTLATAAGWAVENSRLRQAALREERWLSAATSLLQPGAEGSVLPVVAALVRELSGADMAWIATGSDPGRLRVRATAGVLAPLADLEQVDLTRSIERCAAVADRPLRVADLAQHPRSADLSAFGAQDAGPALVVPLRGVAGVEGVIVLAWRHGTEPTDRTASEMLAQHAALTLQAARARPDQLTMTEVLSQRDRSARDLHDLVIQRLFGVGLELEDASWVEDLDEVRGRLDRLVDEVDAAIRDIRSTIFGTGSLRGALDPETAVVDLVDRAARTMKVRPQLFFDGPVGTVVGPAVLPDVLAVLTEALSNVARHAHAGACTVEVSVRGGVALTITDDGEGLPAQIMEGGLTNVRARAEQRGGRMLLDSVPGGGTRLVWSVPPPR